MKEAQIKIVIRNDGTANIDYGQMSALDAAMILAQLVVGLQARTIEQSGGKVLQLAQQLPAGARLS